MSDAIEILLIEDHPIVRDGCRNLLARRPHWTLLEAGGTREALALNRRSRPRVILLDLELPDGKGLDSLEALLSENEDARVIVLSMHQSAAWITKALRSGAKGYITKSDDPATILAAIDKVLDGSVYIGSAAAQNLALAEVEKDSDPMKALNERERQVMVLLGDGKSLAEISAALAIGYKSAANIVSALKQKLHIATSAALIKFAVERRTNSS